MVGGPRAGSGAPTAVRSAGEKRPGPALPAHGRRRRVSLGEPCRGSMLGAAAEATDAMVRGVVVGRFVIDRLARLIHRDLLDATHRAQLDQDGTGDRGLRCQALQQGSPERQNVENDYPAQHGGRPAPGRSATQGRLDRCLRHRTRSLDRLSARLSSRSSICRRARPQTADSGAAKFDSRIMETILPVRVPFFIIDSRSCELAAEGAVE